MSTNTEENHYETLGVDKKASIEEIKKAYRKLSLKHHPDKPTGDEEKFKKISNAYSVLESEDTRKQYDMEQSGSFNDGRHNHLSPEDIFASFFGGHGGGGGMRQGHNNNNHQNMPGFPLGGIFSNMGGMNMGEDMGFPFSGGNIRIFQSGGGCVNGIPIHILNQMNMNNHQKPPPISKTITINMSHVLSEMSVPIEIERWINENGNKIFEKEVLYIIIPKGIDNGEMLTIANKGNVMNDSLKGDVKISIIVENNTDFIREGLDLHYCKKISLKDALCGFSFCLEYINGKIYTLNNNEGSIIVPGYKKLIPNLGLTRENQTGNLIITFEVEFPKEYDIEVIKKLKEIM